MEEQFQNTEAKNELSKLSIKELFFKYVRFLPLFIISVSLALIAAFTYLRYTTPIFQSSGSLIIKEDKTTGDKLNELMSTDNEINLQNEIEQLKSRPVLGRVVNALDLNFSYYAKGNVRESNIYRSAPFEIQSFQLTDSTSSFSLNLSFPNSYSFRIDGDKLISFGQVFKTAHGVFRLVKKEGVIGSDYIVTYSPTNAVGSEFAQNLLVVPKGNTNILILSLEATNPRLAADVVNRLMEEYRKYSVEQKIESINQQLAFIESRLKVVDKELDSITNSILAFKKAQNVFSFESLSGELLGKIQGSGEATSKAEAEMEIIDIIDSYLRDSRNDFSLAPSSLGIGDGTLSNLIAGYNVAQLERKELLDNGVPRANPVVKAKEDQIEKLRQNILESLKNIRSVYRETLSDSRSESSIAKMKIRTLPEKMQRLMEMERQQATKQQVYNILLEQKERSSITLAATTSNIGVVEYAAANPTPIKPNRRNIQLIAVFIGLLLPALFIFLLEVLNDKITTRNDIERLTDITILGEVGHSYGADNLVVKPNSRGIVAEQFRIIRSNLQYVIHNFPKPIILVTSSFSGEGKSFISTNLGSVMALAGKRTIVLEFDIRKPKILAHLNIPKKPGLTNYLLGKEKLENLPVPVPGVDNLFVLACGPVPPNPAEMLLDPKLSEVFDYLRSNFDMVIMDTAPIGMVSDALTLSKFADATLYIARQGHTYKKQVGLIDEFYRQGKLPKISLILNDVKIKSGYGYYGNGRYGYGYGSGYFDDEESAPPSLFGRLFGQKNGTKKKKQKREIV